MKLRWVLATFAASLPILSCACGKPPGLTKTPDVDTGIAAEIGRLRAIDNHAHPVRVVGSGEQDREFDALPVDNMEPSSDPVYLRAGDAGVIEASRALFGGAGKQRTMREEGDGLSPWVADPDGRDGMVG